MGSTAFDEFCDALVGQKPHGWGEADARALGLAELKTLSDNVLDELVTLAADPIKDYKVHFSLFNYARYVRTVRCMAYQLSPTT